MELVQELLESSWLGVGSRYRGGLMVVCALQTSTTRTLRNRGGVLPVTQGMHILLHFTIS